MSVVVDGAKRDRMVWVGDMNLEAPTIYYSSGASKFAGDSLTLWGSIRDSNGEVASVVSPLVVPGVAAGPAFLGGPFYSLSYSIYFVINLYDYYLYTGDKRLVKSEWPAAESEFAYLAGNANGQHLVVTDSLSGHNWQVQDLTGVVTAYNVLYYQALSNAAVMATAIGRQDEAARFARLSSLVQSAINSTLFNATGGRYNLSDTDSATVVQDANSLAVLYGVAPAGKASSILKTIDTALNTVNGPLSQPGSSLISPFMTGYDVFAHFEAGDAEGALGLIRAVWSHMLPGTPFYSGCTFEALQPDGTPPNAGASLAHGWVSGPTSALSKYVLGVRSVSPGYKTWLVEPQPGELSWAEGAVPTPHGPIEVRWEEQGNALFLEITVPDGTCGSVGLPISGSPDTLIVNGQKLKSETTASETGTGRPGYAYVRDLAPGTYRIVNPTDSK